MGFEILKMLPIVLALTVGCGKKDEDPCEGDGRNTFNGECFNQNAATGDTTKSPASTEIIEAQQPEKAPDQPAPAGTVTPTKVPTTPPAPVATYGGCMSGFLFFDGNEQQTASLAVYFDADSKTDSADKIQIAYGLKDVVEKTKVIANKSERIAFISGLTPGQYSFECSAVDPNKTPALEFAGKQKLLVMYNKPAEMKPQYFGCTFAEKGIFPGHETEGLMIHFHYPKSASEISIKRDGQKIYTSYGDSKILDETFKSGEKHKYTCSAVIGGKEIDGLNFLEI